MAIYKKFRTYNVDPAGFNNISPRFDQPTYLSFRLQFAYMDDQWYNGTGSGNNFEINYDRMPHPLFMKKGADKIEDRESYSAQDFLLDNNEFTRAEMLKEFISKFNKLQNEFQWYFQKIDGVNELLKVNPRNGMRVTSDKRLTITTLEGVDLRMTHLLNLYRKIAWDDTYQRWMLPDMMRYFTLKIYISEFRTFHGPRPYDGFREPTRENPNQINELNLQILDDIIPTWIINCEMCEFDLENIEYVGLSNLGIDQEPEQAAVQFQIKVGKIYEEQIYPVFQNMYLFDKLLNGFNRSKENNLTPVDSTNLSEEEIASQGRGNEFQTEKYNSTLQSEQNKTPRQFSNIAQGIWSESGIEEDNHISGTPFNQTANQYSLYGANAAGKDGKLFTEDDNIISVDPTNPNTWIGNAIDFGTAFVTNLGKKFIDKAKVTPIPKLGISFNEVEAALQSKNIITAIGTIRKGIDTVAREYVQPSELLDGKIVDEILKTYLLNVSESKATDGVNKLLQEAANIALNDDGTWTRIKDYSLATNMVSQGEVNVNKTIQGGNNLRDAILESTQGDLSFATNLTAPQETNITKKIDGKIILEGIPSSQATSNKISKG